MDVKHPDVHVKLTGEDSNIFSLTGRVTKALRSAGYHEDADLCADDVFDCGSFDEALQVLQTYVDVT